jgi:hypothetical protein
VSESTDRAGWRHRRGPQLLLRVVSVILAVALAAVAQKQGEQGHVVRAAWAVGGILLVMSWVTDSIAHGVTRFVRGQRGSAG